MAQHDYVIDNATGANVRADLNNALAAIVSQNSGSTAPATTYAFQFWVDTSSGSILKIRNAANSAWLTVGDVSIANFGHLALSGGTLTGAITFSNTDSISIPIGTTAQRPGSPTNGMIRYNTDLVQFEGYDGTGWFVLNDGGYTVSTVQSVTASGTINSTTDSRRQLRYVQGSGGSVSASTTPFGSSGGWKDGTEICLVGYDDTNSVILTFNDAAKGLVGNFSSLELTKYASVVCIYSSALDRWIVEGGR